MNKAKDMLRKQIGDRIEAMMAAERLDGLVLGDLHNIQYATGARIPVALAQPDMVVLALLRPGRRPLLVAPAAWAEAARAHARRAKVVAYGPETRPAEAAVAALAARAEGLARLGVDSGALPVRLAAALAAALKGEQVDCDAALAALRASKTPAEIDRLRALAMKNDHVINGFLHHLIADRKKSSMSLAEGLRVHSLEREMPPHGYNACCRAIVGGALAEVWPYAPQFGFAGVDMNRVGDPMLMEAVNTEGGYWNNAVRLAINDAAMTPAQAAAWARLVRARELLLAALRPGRRASEVFAEVSEAAAAEDLGLAPDLALGFSLGVSAHEGPFLAPGEQAVLGAGMVLVLDPVIRDAGLLYRSRDTVVLREEGAEIVNWWKDWREPYFAIPTI